MAQAKSANKIRKGKWAVILPWLKRFGVRFAVLCVVLWLGAWIHLSGAIGKAASWGQGRVIAASADMGFVVEDILLEGRMYSDRNFISAILNTQRGDPLFSFNPKNARASLEKMEWVSHAHVERRLPDTIYIHLEERQPLALWQVNKELFLLDESGEQIKTSHLSRFSDLVIVMGEGVAPKAPALLDMLRGYPDIHARAKAATWIGGRRWNLHLKTGVTLKLPEENPRVALSRLQKAQKSDGLLDKDLVSIDVRAADKMIVRTKPGAVQEYKSNLSLRGGSKV